MVLHSQKGVQMSQEIIKLSNPEQVARLIDNLREVLSSDQFNKLLTLARMTEHEFDVNKDKLNSLDTMDDEDIYNYIDGKENEILEWLLDTMPTIGRDKTLVKHFEQSEEYVLIRKYSFNELNAEARTYAIKRYLDKHDDIADEVEAENDLMDLDDIYYTNKGEVIP